MSRWRELIMDFGQIFGTEKSYASSDVYSVESDLNAKKASDLQLRRNLEVHFRPLFQRFVYGGEKIACHDLKRLLRDPQYKDRLPEEKLQELEDVADFNKGKAISYNEFVGIVLGHQILDDLASMDSDDNFNSERGKTNRFRDGLKFLCRNTELQELVDEKMDTYKCLPPPFFMICLTVAQIVAFIVFSTEDGVTTDALKDVDPDNSLMYLPTRRREVWRWFSYCLVHQGYADLFFNIAIQLVFGVPLEMIFSWWRMAFIYVSGLVAGSCWHSMVDHYAGLAGSGGGSYAILGAHLYALIRHYRRLNVEIRDSRKVRYLCSIPLRIFFILLLVVPQVGLAVYRRFFVDDIPLKVGFAPYIAGLITGIGFSDGFLVDHKRMPWHGWLLFSCLFSLLILIGSTVIINITWQDYPAEDYS